MGYGLLRLPRETSIRRGVFNRNTARLLERAARQVPDDAVSQISAFGTAEDCLAKIEKFIRVGAKHIVISNQGPDREATMHALSHSIIPYLRGTYSD